MNDMVRGQPQVAEAIAPLVAGYFRGMRRNIEAPIASLLLVGPTGAGKSSTAKALAYALHRDASKYIDVDCTGYFDQHQVNRLIGPPPGFLGFGTSRPVIDQLRLLSVTTPRCPVSIVLFDEIEKAHESLTRLMIGIAGKGKLDTVSTNISDTEQAVDFTRTIVLITTNVGSDLAADRSGDRYHISGQTHRSFGEVKVIEAVKKFLPAELFKRLTTVYYRPLGKDVLMHVLDKALTQLNMDLGEAKPPTQLEVTARAADYIVDRAESVYGARAVLEMFDKEVYHRVVKARPPRLGETLHLDLVGGELVCDYAKKEAAA